MRELHGQDATGALEEPTMTGQQWLAAGGAAAAYAVFTALVLQRERERQRAREPMRASHAITTLIALPGLTAIAAGCLAACMAVAGPEQRMCYRRLRQLGWSRHDAAGIMGAATADLEQSGTPETPETLHRAIAKAAAQRAIATIRRETNRQD